ncbi:PAS domain S-box-containing protein [Mucilaginibacter yixingensis]|uniref:histidine kinase n=1 Tax=Mucilaginibacter yixingensis TaxID=1295612 RepID=A0A2T5J8Z7_9SPHI|nr:PAS domain-containing protein [Mucilaginibacter yixingensis]PTQ96537.1 PAS domain S-box-containing protein [Mucilaginibacter yixingensis]
MKFIDNEHLKELVNSAPIGIAVLDAATQKTELLNDKFLEIAGKPPHSIIGKWYWESFAEVRHLFEDDLNRASQGETIRREGLEIPLIRHGREEMIVINFVYAPLRSDAGEIVKVVVWVLENTKEVAQRLEEKAAKTAFQAERDRLKSFFMQAPAGICILEGPELVYELVNPAYQALMPERKLLGRPIFEALPELIGTPLETILRDVYHTGEAYTVRESLVPIAEFEGGPVHDRFFTFNYEARHGADGHVDGIMVFVFEVTEMLEVQQALRASHERAEQQKRLYETITSNTPDLMYVFSLDYRFLYANTALLNMWGKTAGEAVGKGLRENGYEEWHALMHEREIDQVRATKQPVRGEVGFPHATMGKRIYDYILIPVIGADGEVEAVAGTTRDVTDRKQAEESLQLMNEEMAASNEELATTNDELIQIQQLLQVSEQRSKSLMAAAPFPIGVYTGREMRILMANQAIIEVWGKGNDVIGKTYREVLPELAGQQIFEQLDRVFLTGETFHARSQRVDIEISGHLQPFYFNYSFTPLHDADGEVYGIMNTGADITDLVLAKQQVEQNEENLRNMVAQAPVAMCIMMGPSHVITVANALMVELWGKPQADVMNKPVFDALPDARGQGLELVIQNVYETGETFYASEMPVSLLRHGKPEVVYQNFVYKAYRDTSGKIAGVFAITIDVTAQVNARAEVQRANEEMAAANEELATTNKDLTEIQLRYEAINRELETSASRLRMAIESTGLGTWEYRLLTGELYWSKECRDVYGIPAGIEPTFSAFADHIHPDDRAVVEADIQKALDPAGDGHYNISYRILRFDTGETRWIKAQGNVYFEEQQPQLFIGTVVDIHDLKEADEKSAKLAAIIETSHDAIVSKTLEGIVTSWNESAQRVFGYSAEEMIGESIYKLIPPERYAEEPHILATIARGERINHFETKRVRSDGQLIDVSVTVSPIKDKAGRIIGVSKIARDITEKKLDETRKNDFIGMVSHELKTPLTSLSAVVQVAKLKLQHSEDSFLAGAMQKADQQVKRMTAMINGFLNISRLESGKIHIDKQTFDLIALLGEMIAEAELTAGGQQIRFSPCPAIPISADRDKIASVISNLLNNAIKYSPKGAEIDVHCMRSNAEVTVSVQDRGMGIKPEDLERIFDRYYRVESNHTRHIAGFGIGLYLSSEIIQRHGGKVWAESESDKGSTFYFSLPL